MSHPAQRGADHSDGSIMTNSISSAPPIVVLVTGAAGMIAYSLVFMIARGDMFGKDRRVILHLLDLPFASEKLEALVMELEDVASPLLSGIVATSDYATAFTDIDVALLVGARPRTPGMERKDLLIANASIFQGQGEALDKYAKRTVKVLCVGNPANTNALIASRSAPSLPKSAFTCLSRLDHNRASAALAKKLGANPGDIKGVIIWGNHSTTQYADARFAMREGHPRPSDSSSVAASIGDKSWLQNTFVHDIQQRGGVVMTKRQSSSAASAACAIVDHMRDWCLGTQGNWVSMGAYSDGTAYGIAEDIFFSVPCLWFVENRVKFFLMPPPHTHSTTRAHFLHFTSTFRSTQSDGKGGFRIVTDLSLDEFSKSMVTASIAELLEERDSVKSLFPQISA